MDYQNLIESLDPIIQAAPETEELRELKTYLERCFSPITPSHKRSIKELNGEFINHLASIPREHAAAYDSLRREAISLINLLRLSTENIHLKKSKEQESLQEYRERTNIL